MLQIANLKPGKPGSIPGLSLQHLRDRSALTQRSAAPREGSAWEMDSACFGRFHPPARPPESLDGQLQEGTALAPSL